MVVLKPLERTAKLELDRLGCHAAAYSGKVAKDPSGRGQPVAIAAREGLLQQAREALKLVIRLTLLKIFVLWVVVR